MQYQDIHLSDSQLFTLFKQYFSNGNYTQALNILSQNPQLDTKKIVAETINDFNERLLGFENEYYTEVEQYLSKLLINMQTDVNSLSNRNEYDGGIQYFPKNFVFYNDEIYFCTQEPPIGTLPTDTRYWLYLGLKGENGHNSLINMNFKGLYSNSVDYNKYDIVYQGLTFYYAIQNNINQPLDDSNYWGILFETSPQQVITNSIMPVNINSKDFWWQEI